MQANNFLRRALLFGIAAAFGIFVGAAPYLFAADLNISGEWSFSVDLKNGGHGEPKFVLKQQGNKISGTYSGPLGEHEVTGTIEGAKAVFGFEFSQEGENIKATYTAVIESATKMRGTVVFKTSGGEKAASGDWTATKP
jgi:hypothetical protein